ncbi:hypothetical protein HYY74_08030 [Candidatus Woesearchaeota archaeon]|nr:hypothetical protein [Candidatus Woesearchaeota archaeon]
MKPSSYYEAILQLRSPNRDIEAYAEQEIGKAASKGVFLSRRKRAGDGYDYYLSSNRFAANLGRALKRKFGGHLKISEKLHTRDRQTSRDLYRTSVLYRPASVMPGDVVTHGDEVVLVSSVGRKIAGTAIPSGRRVFLDMDAEPEKKQTQDSLVTKVYPVPEAMSLSTYENIPLLVGRKVAVGEKVRVVVHRGKAYAVK